ncbi:MAG: hypothetical protein M5R36_00610 [Deltaproteobacteria bacterium]|nr:hypothetical protein [Deltaproteobacteria bacterium]
MRALGESESFDFRTRRPGEPFAARLDADNRLRRFTYATDLLTNYIVEPGDDGRLGARIERLPTETETVVFRRAHRRHLLRIDTGTRRASQTRGQPRPRF